MNNLLSDFQNSAERVLENLKNDLSSLRTGRATPALVENIIVDAYQGQTKLKLTELATTTMVDPQTLHIIPFDPSIIKDIEKAIFKSPLGITPNVTGTKIILKLPALSQEQREKILKVVNQKIEEKKENIRITRDDMRRKIKNLLDKKEITEDDKFRLEKEIDKATQKFNETISTIKHNKEKEIMEV